MKRDMRVYIEDILESISKIEGLETSIQKYHGKRLQE